MGTYPYARNDAVWKEEINYFPLLIRPDEMTDSSRRARTFALWPRSAPDITRELAESGLYYTGIGDMVKCYRCSRCLDRWTGDQSPGARHLEASPKCQAAQGWSRARSSVSDLSKWDGCSEAQLSNDNGEQVSVRKSRLAVDGCSEAAEKRMTIKGCLHEPVDSYDGTAEEKSLASCMKSIQQLGYSDEDVQEACKLLKGDKKEINTDSLIDTIYDLQKQKENAKPSKTLRAKSCVKAANVNNEYGVPKEYSKPIKPTRVPHEVATKIAKEKERLQKLIDEARTQGLCRVCGVQPACVLYLPCAHKVACPSCTKTRTTCPVDTCQKIIRGTKQVFYG